VRERKKTAGPISLSNPAATGRALQRPIIALMFNDPPVGRSGTLDIPVVSLAAPATAEIRVTPFCKKRLAAFFAD